MSDLTRIATSPRRIRQRNELAVLRALHEHGRSSRADLARVLGLNRSSSGNIIQNLLTEGLVYEVEDNAKHGSGKAGRPGILLELVPDAVSFLGIEIGVEHISAVELDLAGRVTRSRQEPFDGRATGVELALARALHLAMETMPPERLARCEGVGIATPSQMDRAGMIRLAPLMGWRDVDMAALARKMLPQDMAVMVENDANAFAIGVTYGRRNARNGVTLLVNIESGVGGGILIDGQLFRGATGLAGEIGHLRMAQDDPETLEQRIGLARLLAQYRQRTGRAEAALPDLLRDVRDREPQAVAIAEDWARALAFALSQVCRIIDADAVVLGGSVAALYPMVSARVLTHLRGYQGACFTLPAITLAESVATGAAYGAACMVHQRFLSLESARFSAADYVDTTKDG